MKDRKCELIRCSSESYLTSFRGRNFNYDEFRKFSGLHPGRFRVIKNDLTSHTYGELVTVFYKASVDSTMNSIAYEELLDNTDYKKSEKSNSVRPWIIIAARVQNNGLGRNNNLWLYTGEEQLYSTICMKLNYIDSPLYERVSLLPLASSIAVALSIRDAFNYYYANNKSPEIRLKWPNDVWIKGKGKCCGVKVNVDFKNDDYMNISIGIGVNIRRNRQYTALEDCVDGKIKFGKEVILGGIVKHLRDLILLNPKMRNIRHKMFDKIIKLYSSMWMHKSGEVKFEAEWSSVICIDDTGGLVIRTKDDISMVIYSYMYSNMQWRIGKA
ncbi:hypothetical protein GJ496_010929 [Pomphorhynchus laevis]|nr:hypothetical protein GJ496_010929 [Pomphorhynchus laevis]